MNFKNIEDLRISDCCDILHIKQENILVELIDFQTTNEVEILVLNQLKNILKKDKVAYESCHGLSDYITYVDEWHDGQYVPMAKERIKELSTLNIHDIPSDLDLERPPFLERPAFATFSIYILLIGSVISFFTCLQGSTWNVLNNPELFGIEVYGKGYIPACLISLTVFVGNIFILRKKAIGFWIISLIGLIIVMPTIFYDYELVLWFSIPLGLALLLYYFILHIKQKGYSAWDMMEKSPSIKKINLYTWIIFLALVLLTPPLLSMSFGFRSNYYDNGLAIFEARWGVDDAKSYYSNKLANKLSYGSDGIGYINDADVRIWHERAIRYSKHNWLDYVFYDYADYLISIDDYKSAYRVLNNADSKYHNSETSEKLNHFIRQYGSF